MAERSKAVHLSCILVRGVGSNPTSAKKKKKKKYTIFFFFFNLFICFIIYFSRQRDSNSRPSAYKADAITTMLCRLNIYYINIIYIKIILINKRHQWDLNPRGQNPTDF